MISSTSSRCVAIRCGIAARANVQACLALLLVVCLVSPSLGRTHATAADKPLSVLLVGNSVVFFNDLPAHMEAIARSAGDRAVTVTMLAGPGRRMDQHAQDGAVEMLLATQRFDWLVLQEVGGTLTCDEDLSKYGFDCGRSHQAHRRLADLAKAHGTRVLILGTYSLSSDANARALAKAERALADTLSAEHASLAELDACRKSYPYYRWLAPDRGHPGPDLTAMMAIRALESIGLHLRFRDSIVFAGHGFDLPRWPHPSVPHRERDALPLTPVVQWAYAANVLQHMQACDARVAESFRVACDGQPRCLGRDLVWVPNWLSDAFRRR